ncbi:hypothetical protein Ciccas_006469 [Cichlidogyrus casuarinus]|uniref:Alpha N-terminal protein methyltransferase 1 n=1 Tax=Cichlidogyrus casuarinus TaxID=1844966 RepID=A0ABD2Q5Q2_9PLAT
MKGKQDYQASFKYWDGVTATMDGMLGGLSFTHPPDISQSKSFLEKNAPGFNYRRSALDCGAGIGRITKSVLSPIFDHISLLEPNANFLAQARSHIGEELFQSKILHLYEKGMQEFDFSENYDLIWIQWCTGYLTDNDFVNFLIKCGQALSPDNPDSCIILKENLTNSQKFDAVDSSVTRSMPQLKKIFNEAGLYATAQEQQKNFPKNLYPMPKQQEILEGFNKLRSEQQAIARNIADLEINQHEQIRVIATLKGVEPIRKCFRLIDDVLVEKTVQDILPTLISEESKMKPAIEDLKEQLEAKGNELLAYKKEHNIRFSNEPKADSSVDTDAANLPSNVQKMVVK